VELKQLLVRAGLELVGGASFFQFIRLDLDCQWQFAPQESFTGSGDVLIHTSSWVCRDMAGIFRKMLRNYSVKPVARKASPMKANSSPHSARRGVGRDLGSRVVSC